MFSGTSTIANGEIISVLNKCSLLPQSGHLYHLFKIAKTPIITVQKNFKAKYGKQQKFRKPKLCQQSAGDGKPALENKNIYTKISYASWSFYIISHH